MNGWMLLLLSAQAILAVAALSLFKLSVLPVLGPDRRREIILDVWGPIALAAPFIVAAVGVDLTVAGAGWIVVGGPVCVGAFLAGSALLVGPLPAVMSLPLRLRLSLAGAGLVVLLLAAAHDLTIWSGQVIFALAAVILWINSPPAPDGGWFAEDEHATTAESQRSRRTARLGPGSALTLMVLLGLAQGVCVLWSPSAASGPWPGLLLIGYGFGAGIMAAGSRGASSAIRIGGWTAALGSLLGIGAMSVAHLLPQAVAIVQGKNVEVRTHVAHSFGVFGPDGALLLSLSASLWLALLLAGFGRRVLGFVLIAVAAALVAARLTDLLPASSLPGG